MVVLKLHGSSGTDTPSDVRRCVKNSLETRAEVLGKKGGRAWRQLKEMREVKLTKSLQFGVREESTTGMFLLTFTCARVSGSCEFSAHLIYL